mmetsp:Transcript_36783/g.35515  ORF Transcript_36783/g.35515 Transcript_36783/m.35515 type:complete len:84 (-) Transcript_36783:62-313(-)
MCWSFDEAAKYIQTLKAYENKSQSILEGKNVPGTHMEQATEALSSIRRINKRDAQKLLLNYGSLQDIILHDNYNDFMDIDGIG